MIKKNGDTLDFYLVDLNRMEFKPLNFEARIKNFSRLTIHKAMIEVMSDEYSKCIGENFNTVYNLMWKFTNEFRENRQRKKQLKFWKKS